MVRPSHVLLLLQQFDTNATSPPLQPNTRLVYHTVTGPVFTRFDLRSLWKPWVVRIVLYKWENTWLAILNFFNIKNNFQKTPKVYRTGLTWLDLRSLWRPWVVWNVLVEWKNTWLSILNFSILKTISKNISKIYNIDIYSVRLETGADCNRLYDLCAHVVLGYQFPVVEYSRRGAKISFRNKPSVWCRGPHTYRVHC